MTTMEIVTAVISTGSLVVAIIALSRSTSANKAASEISREQLRLGHATVEMDLAGHIRDSKHRTEDVYATYGDFLESLPSQVPDSARATYDRVKRLSKAANEGYLNALDNACQKFFDNKVDRVRFVKSWQREMRQTVQDEAYKEYFVAGHAFHALMRFYDEHENPERAKVG